MFQRRMNKIERKEMDGALLKRFEEEIWHKIPHLENTKIINPTPLVELTKDLKECAKTIYKIDLEDKDLKVYGKFDSTLPSGSIKSQSSSSYNPQCNYFWKSERRSNSY